MKPFDPQEVRLTSPLNSFQREMQLHLVRWKWEHITHEPGFRRGRANDALLPQEVATQFPVLYPDIVKTLHQHRQRFPFRLHQFFYHMASSQMANLNLFLPVVTHPQVNTILAALKPDFARLATDYLDQGYRIEFWDDPYGNLGDHTHISGTDADIAIAYYNHQDALCLWLIEHKLTESEFTPCGGFKSKGRQPQHDCSRPFVEILSQPNLCYYHDKKRFRYWQLTQTHQDFFARPDGTACPFQGGLNQLWRNQLLGLSIEQDERQPYQQVTFSVVKHPRNRFLDNSLAAYRQLVGNTPKFTVFTSADMIAAAMNIHDPALDHWIAWYKDLYAL